MRLIKLLLLLLRLILLRSGDNFYHKSYLKIIILRTIGALLIQHIIYVVRFNDSIWWFKLVGISDTQPFYNDNLSTNKNIQHSLICVRCNNKQQKNINKRNNDIDGKKKKIDRGDEGKKRINNNKIKNKKKSINEKKIKKKKNIDGLL